ncbi:MAG: phasin family protein [Gallionella sp.]
MPQHAHNGKNHASATKQPKHSGSKELFPMFSDQINALMKSGSAASSIMKDVGSEVTAHCSHCFSDAIKISKESLGCRTWNDMMQLQHQAWRQFFDDYAQSTTRLCDAVIHGYTEAMVPLNECTKSASEQFRKALAA